MNDRIRPATGSPSTRPAWRAWLPWLLLALAVIVTAIVYWPGVTGGWVFDDYPNIVDNAAIHIQPGHATLVAWLNAALSSPASFLHRPLASITFALNWMQGGGNPYPFKVTNIAIHLVNGVLVFFMLRALLRLLGLRGMQLGPLSVREEAVRSAGRVALPQGTALHPAPTVRGDGGEGTTLAQRSAPRESEPSPAPSGHPRPEGEGNSAVATRIALVVAAAWMLLPINLMAVLYVVQRMESLCQVFVLAGLWAYLHGRWMMLTATDPGRDRRGLALAVCGIVFGTLLGLTSKETAVLLPVFCFLAEAVVMRFWRIDLRNAGIEPSPAPAGSAYALARRSPLPEGEGSVLEPLSQRERGRGEGTTFAQHPTLRESVPSPGASRHPLPEGEGNKRQDYRLWGMFTLVLFIPAILGFLWLLRGVLRPAALAGRDFTLGERLLTEQRVLVDYLHWTLFPNPMVLSLYHDEIKLSTGILAPGTTLGAILLLAALIVVAVWLRNRRPLVSLGIAWFFAGNLLTASIIPLELVYEQRMYFASIGVLLAAAALLLGRRWRIRLPLLRGFIVGVALLWFALATNLRAQEWSNPLRLAVAEANRHPESPRAVYEAGRLLLIASNYEPGQTIDASWKYLREAAAIPGSSSLPDQAMIMIADHHHHGDDAAYWASMIHKLRDQPTRQEDISALISLTNCYGAGICKFDPANLNRAYEAALSRPHPIARLNGAYADFQRDILHDDPMAIRYLALAVRGAPSESAYRMDLAALYARNGQIDKAQAQIAALKQMNLAGRLDGQIATLERLVKQAKTATPSGS